MFAIPPVKYQSSVCNFPTCAAPLGHESKENGFLTCHDHRACAFCGLEVSAPEIRNCFSLALDNGDGENSDSIEIKHARCSLATKPNSEFDPTLTLKQSFYDRLNLARLMVDPDMELAISTNENNAMLRHTTFIACMTHDQLYAHQKMLEACLANVSLAIQTDKKELKKRADVREEKFLKAAKREAATSSRPVGKPADDPVEQSLAEFMTNFGFKSRKLALSKQKDRDKAVEQLMKIGIPSALAKANADKMLLDNIAKGTVKLED